MKKIIGVLLGLGALGGLGYYFSKKKKSVDKNKKPAKASEEEKSDVAKPSKKTRTTKRLTPSNCKAVKDNRVVGGYKATKRKRKAYKKK